MTNSRASAQRSTRDASMLRGVDQELLSRHDALGYLNVADDELDELRTLAAEE